MMGFYLLSEIALIAFTAGVWYNLFCINLQSRASALRQKSTAKGAGHMAKDLLVGSTGFVGGNLAAKHAFAAVCHSTDIAAQFGAKPDLCVYAGVPAAMFLANADRMPTLP